VLRIRLQVVPHLLLRGWCSTKDGLALPQVAAFGVITTGRFWVIADSQGRPPC
jgi:hypothetical protein